MKEINRMRLNYRDPAPEPTRRCGDCFYFQDCGDADGRCFGHRVSPAGTCDAFTGHPSTTPRPEATLTA